MNRLKTELDRFMSGTKSNPPLAKMQEFLRKLSAEGKLIDYSEADWIEAGRAYGLTDDEIAAWIESAASWIDDTTNQGEFEMENAFWG